MKLYLDTSALVKLVQLEAETEALRGYLRRHPADLRITSALARVELVRAVLPGGPEAVAHARRQLGRLHQVILDRTVLDQAATLVPGTRLRSLDAIHIATAQAVGADLRAVVTYDNRMQELATAVRLPVEAPSN